MRVQNKILLEKFFWFILFSHDGLPWRYALRTSSATFPCPHWWSVSHSSPHVCCGLIARHWTRHSISRSSSSEHSFSIFFKVDVSSLKASSPECKASGRRCAIRFQRELALAATSMMLASVSSLRRSSSERPSEPPSSPKQRFFSLDSQLPSCFAIERQKSPRWHLAKFKRYKLFGDHNFTSTGILAHPPTCCLLAFFNQSSLG